MPALANTPLDPNRPAAQGREEVVYSNPWVSVKLIPSEFGPFTVIGNSKGDARTGGAVVVSDGARLLLVQQDRHAVGVNTWEIPRGSSNHDEAAGVAGLREVAEETGYHVDGNWSSLGHIMPDTGALNSRAELLFVHANASTAPREGDGEVTAVHWVPIDVVVDACATGLIEDSFTVVAVLRARHRGLI